MEMVAKPERPTETGAVKGARGGGAGAGIRRKISAMGSPPDITPAYYQILIVRELRKAGMDVGDPLVHRRSELPEPQQGFVLELLVSLGLGQWRKRALIACTAKMVRWGRKSSRSCRRG